MTDASLAPDFQPWGILHLSCLLICVLGIFLICFTAKKREQFVRRAVILGCIGSWIANVSFFLHPDNFAWGHSLPLHYCNLANLIGAAALVTRKRAFQSLLYFWTFALCIWAFLTPALLNGPDSLEFWIFWIYHLFIILAVTFVLQVDQFRPAGRDLGFVIIATTVWSALLAVVNASTGWNYGFVGPGKPDQPSLMDFLGPYPLRLLWIWILGVVLMSALLLPFSLMKKRTNYSPTQ